MIRGSRFASEPRLGLAVTGRNLRAISSSIRRRSTRTVCLDFSRDHLSAVEVVDGTISAWETWPLPPGILFNGDPVDSPSLGDLVRRCLPSIGVQGKQVRMAMPDEATVSRHLVMPRMPRRELVQAMRFTAEQHIPFPIGRARYSWDVVEMLPEGIRVYLVAAWRDVVDRYAEVARIAGLQPEVLEPRSVAVARALDQDRALLVDTGANSLYLTLFIDGQPMLVDEQPLEGTAGDRREAMDRLLHRAFRYQSMVPGEDVRMAPVLLAGELELAEFELPISGRPVTQVLNGHMPPPPPGFHAGKYLANLGLAMRSSR